MVANVVAFDADQEQEWLRLLDSNVLCVEQEHVTTPVEPDSTAASVATVLDITLPHMPLSEGVSCCSDFPCDTAMASTITTMHDATLQSNLSQKEPHFPLVFCSPALAFSQQSRVYADGEESPESGLNVEAAALQKEQDDGKGQVYRPNTSAGDAEPPEVSSSLHVAFKKLQLDSARQELQVTMFKFST
jgi:hypothetical protein